MSDFAKSGQVPQLGSHMPLPRDLPNEPPRYRPQIHNHRPGEYCFFCPCQDCSMFFGKATPNRCVEPLEPTPPRYGDIGLVNSMRAAAAKREEDRQDKLRAERESMAATAEAPKKDKAAKDQPKKKNLRQNMKRRRL